MSVPGRPPPIYSSDDPIPSIGRIVHFHAGLALVWPAIITKVHTPECVGLTLFPPGETPHPYSKSEKGMGQFQWFWPPRVP